MTRTATTPATTTTEVATPTQENLLLTLMADLALEHKDKAEPKVFKSDNTGVYVSANIKAPDARALGIHVPVGGKVKLTLMAIVVDPANSKDA